MQCGRVEKERRRGERNPSSEQRMPVEDNDHPSFEKLSREILRPKILTEALNAESTLEQPTLHWAGLQVNRAQPGSGKRQDGSRGAGNEAEGTSGDGNTGHIEQVASLHNTFRASDLASEPHGVPSTPAQAQPHTLPQSSKPLQDQTNQQGVDDITRSTLLESAFHLLPEPSDGGDDRWTNESMADLEKELGLTLEEEQVELPFADQESCEMLLDVGPQLRTLVGAAGDSRGGGRRGRSDAAARELTSQKEELGQPAVGDQQHLVEIDDADDHEDNEATEALPTAQPKIPEINEQYGGNIQTDMDILRVRDMRSRLYKGRKVFEYQVDAFGLDESPGWITEDQLKISLSPMLVAKHRASSFHPLGEAQRDVLLRHSATPTSDEYHHASRDSRSSAPADPALGSNLATLKR
ncbi:hypothetical protein B7494_g6427 [Chlorociboria aeruginascens]|nr:hypothetical protein B7494_g6427 [Chlorociboria aeruginascens]